MRRFGLVACGVLALAGALEAGQRRPPAKPPAKLPARAAPAKSAPAPVLKKQPADVKCPSELGTGVTTKLLFCDVLTGRDPAEGILVSLPPHTGPLILTFELHNRHTYSEEQTRANRAFARYTATVGVLTTDNTLVQRGVIQSEFRRIEDLVDRVSGGAGPNGVKAVAPTGTESISVTIPEKLDRKTPINQVSILGEKLLVERQDGSATYSAPGRPIAILSNISVEFKPAPPRPPPKPASKARR